MRPIIKITVSIEILRRVDVKEFDCSSLFKTFWIRLYWSFAQKLAANRTMRTGVVTSRDIQLQQLMVDYDHKAVRWIYITYLAIAPWRSLSFYLRHQKKSVQWRQQGRRKR